MNPEIRELNRIICSDCDEREYENLRIVGQGITVIDDSPNVTITTTGDITTTITAEISDWVRTLSEDPRQEGGY